MRSRELMRKSRLPNPGALCFNYIHGKERGREAPRPHLDSICSPLMASSVLLPDEGGRGPGAEMGWLGQAGRQLGAQNRPMDAIPPYGTPLSLGFSLCFSLSDQANNARNGYRFKSSFPLCSLRVTADPACAVRNINVPHV